ncbi:hypothetical protein IW138_005148 [Coemansia sp. RSA 986]|nr:hypothetical protein IW138_005148 [Coemansia sp. RSA 986]
MDSASCLRIKEAMKAKVGGMDDEVDTLVSRFSDYTNHTADSWQQARAGPAGVILCGIPGSGKTALAATFAQSSDYPFRIIRCPELFASDQGQSEAQLLSSFAYPRESSSENACTKWVLVLEDIDVLSGSSKPDSLEARMHALLLECIDATSAFVVATTSRIVDIPFAMKRSGRLDTIIKLHLSDVASRVAALKIILCEFHIASNATAIDRIAHKTHGFSPADLQSLCLKAFIESKTELSADKLLDIADTMRPSNLRTYQSKIPVVHLEDIFGMDQAIQKARALVVEPLCNAEKYKRMRVEPPHGALIHGPPGCGKSMLCYAVSNELGINTIAVDAAQLRSMVVGETEKAIADLFCQARESAPCILLLDNVPPPRGTSITSENTSDRIVTSLLVEMDGFNAHANKYSRPDSVDVALLRPGRLDVHIKLQLPNPEQRMEMLKGYMHKLPLGRALRDDVEFLANLAGLTEGLSGK